VLRYLFLIVAFSSSYCANYQNGSTNPFESQNISDQFLQFAPIKNGKTKEIQTGGFPNTNNYLDLMNSNNGYQQFSNIPDNNNTQNQQQQYQQMSQNSQQYQQKNLSPELIKLISMMQSNPDMINQFQSFLLSQSNSQNNGYNHSNSKNNGYNPNPSRESITIGNTSFTINQLKEFRDSRIFPGGNFQDSKDSNFAKQRNMNIINNNMNKNNDNNNSSQSKSKRIITGVKPQQQSNNHPWQNNKLSPYQTQNNGSGRYNNADNSCTDQSLIQYKEMNPVQPFVINASDLYNQVQKSKNPDASRDVSNNTENKKENNSSILKLENSQGRNNNSGSGGSTDTTDRQEIKLPNGGVIYYDSKTSKVIYSSDGSIQIVPINQDLVSYNLINSSPNQNQFNSNQVNNNIGKLMGSQTARNRKSDEPPSDFLSDNDEIKNMFVNDSGNTKNNLGNPKSKKKIFSDQQGSYTDQKNIFSNQQGSYTDQNRERSVSNVGYNTSREINAQSNNQFFTHGQSQQKKLGNQVFTRDQSQQNQLNNKSGGFNNFAQFSTQKSGGFNNQFNEYREDFLDLNTTKEEQYQKKK
jgi:hypothetical protein